MAALKLKYKDNDETAFEFDGDTIGELRVALIGLVMERYGEAW